MSMSARAHCEHACANCLDHRDGGVSGDGAVVLSVAGHLDVTVHTPRRAPTETERTSIYATRFPCHCSSKSGPDFTERRLVLALI